MEGIGMMIFSLLFIGSGVACLIYVYKQNKVCTVKTQGMVVGFVRGARTRSMSASVQGFDYSGGSYFPIIEYNGGVRAIPKSGERPPKFKEGEIVTIYYNPNNLSQIRLDEVSFMVYVGGGFAALGLVMFIIGLIIQLR